MESILCHIMPLVINSLGGGHTHTHTHTHTQTHIQTIRTGPILGNQARAGLRPARAWFKNCEINPKVASYIVLCSYIIMSQMASSEQQLIY